MFLPDSVEERRENCLSKFKRLSRGIFGECSSLRPIGRWDTVPLAPERFLFWTVEEQLYEW